MAQVLSGVRPGVSRSVACGQSGVWSVGIWVCGPRHSGVSPGHSDVCPGILGCVPRHSGVWQGAFRCMARGPPVCGPMQYVVCGRGWGSLGCGPGEVRCEGPWAVRCVPREHTGVCPWAVRRVARGQSGVRPGGNSVFVTGTFRCVVPGHCVVCPGDIPVYRPGAFRCVARGHSGVWLVGIPVCCPGHSGVWSRVFW